MNSARISLASLFWIRSLSNILSGLGHDMAVKNNDELKCRLPKNQLSKIRQSGLSSGALDLF